MYCFVYSKVTCKTELAGSELYAMRGCPAATSTVAYIYIYMYNGCHSRLSEVMVRQKDASTDVLYTPRHLETVTGAGARNAMNSSYLLPGRGVPEKGRGGHPKPVAQNGENDLTTSRRNCFFCVCVIHWHVVICWIFHIYI